MADTFGTPEASPEKAQAKSNSKTVIILIILIILAGIGLAFTIATQNKDNRSTTIIPAAQATTTDTPTDTTPPTPEKLKERRESPIPDQSITQAQIDERVNGGSCLTIVDETVYDITEFLRTGAQEFDIKEEDICGKDGTKILTEERNGRPPMEELGPFSPYDRPLGKLVK